ncbi:hypothetical protein KKG31_02010 [Patescibacteria group bacterium]|nr:hypothetical protein [Patescibacteria group bacterium]MBU1757947.1 hypothetical protein [Patescibacteria group bacterium]
MDIIDTFLQIKQQLGCQKHTPMDAFLKANPDFLRFTKANEEVIKKIVNINKISYMDTHEESPSGYTTEDIIDMTIGLKSSSAQQIVQEKPK